MLKILILDEQFAVCRLEPLEPVPDWATFSSLLSVTRTASELSIVCPESDVPEGVRCERGWRCLGVEGQLDFAMVGVIRSLAEPLADADIAIFVFSTFDTDYFMVKEDRLDAAVECLSARGHQVAPAKG